MKKAQSPNLSHIIYIFIGVLLTLVLATVALKGLANHPMTLDEFPINYLAAKNWLADGRSPYDLANGNDALLLVNVENEIGTTPIIEYFRYPLLTTLIIMPMTLLPLVTAKALMMVINCMAMVVAISLLVISFRPKTKLSIFVGTVLFGVLNPYCIYAILTASLKPIVLLIICLTIYLLLHHQDKLAGIIFTVALVEFQMSVFLAVYFLLWAGINKRRSFSRNFWVVLVFQIVLSVILSPSWPAGWLLSLIQDVSHNGLYSSFISQIIGSESIQKIWLNLGIHLGLFLAMIILWLTHRNREGHPFLWVSALTLIITSVIVFPAIPGLLIINLQALILVMYVWLSRWERYGSPFFWSLITILFLTPWVLVLLQTLMTGSKTEVLFSIFYPIIGFVGLWWIRWWILKPDLSSSTLPDFQ